MIAAAVLAAAGCRASATSRVAFPGSVSCTRARVPRDFVRPAHGVPRLPSGVALGLRVNLANNAGSQRCAVAELARVLGATVVREDLSWSSVEPQPGLWRWGRYDAVFRTAAQHGLAVLPLLDDVPSWATDGGSNESLPRDPSSFAAFAGRAAARYGPGGQFWAAHPGLARYAPATMEVLNEPYGHSDDPAAYARLVRKAGAAVRASNSRVGLLAAVAPGAWLDGLYAADPQIFSVSATAGAAVHPYATKPPSAAPAADTERRVETVHAVMSAHGDGGRGVWITEIGWSTCPGASECVSESTQASDLAGTFRLAATTWRPWLRGLVFYQGREYAPRSPSDKEAYFGLTRPNGTAKPALGVFAAAAGR
ncbi:MAG: endo,4-beta-xylanase [Solirubrobacterales bacterium]|nr:endo,4-beta-xylanase [Solirubrobacterales bacterium]